jgi:membrane protein DedA with SNARE-associated domain
LLRRKFPKGKIDAVFGLVRRYGALAVVVPALLPPPFPFKIFVLSSGVLGLPYSRFLAAILAGRAIRYFGEAFLAVRYGALATGYLEANATKVLYAALGLVLAVVSVVLWRRLRRYQRARKGGPSLEARPLEEP